MELSINPSYVMRKYGTGELREPLEAFRLCLDAGFKLFDHTPNTTADDWEARAYKLADELAGLGGQIHQTHAPYNRYKKEDVELFTERVRRQIKASSIVGAKYIVIHADEYRSPDKPFTPEDALEYIVGYYRPLVEYAASLGVTAAIENLFEDNCGPRKGERSRYTSYAEEVLAVMDAFAEYNAGCCWDFGHAHVSYGKEDIHGLEKVASRLVCTHVHDNSHHSDLHQIPYEGEIDWTAQMKCLRDANYQGNISLELVYGRYPDALVPDMLAYAYKSASALLADGQ